MSDETKTISPSRKRGVNDTEALDKLFHKVKRVRMNFGDADGDCYGGDVPVSVVEASEQELASLLARLEKAEKRVKELPHE